MIANKVITCNTNRLTGAMVIVTPEALEAQKTYGPMYPLLCDKQLTHKIIQQVWVQLLHSCKQRNKGEPFLKHTLTFNPGILQPQSTLYSDRLSTDKDLYLMPIKTVYSFPFKMLLNFSILGNLHMLRSKVTVSMEILPDKQCQHNIFHTVDS